MLRVLPADGTLREPALALLYSHLPADERARQLASLFAAVARGDIVLDDLLAACRDGAVVGTLLAVRRPGQIAFVWPPSVAEGADADAVAAQLLHAAAVQMDRHGVLFTQCLLRPHEGLAIARLTAAGFPYLAEMLLLSRPADDLRGQPAPQDSFVTQSYHTSIRPRFVCVVEQACAASHDFPQLAGLRTGEQMLTAHEQTGASVTKHWQLYHRDGIDAGALLMADLPEQDTLEIAYLGVIPTMRRRGLGRTMLESAVSRAAALGRVTVTAAVDAANVEARRLYQSLDFIERDRFQLYLRVRASGAPSSAAELSTAAGKP